MFSVARISGPSAIAVAGDVPGPHLPDDPGVTQVIAAVQNTVDGPTGWLGRCIGKQRLRMEAGHFPCRDLDLPYPPLIGNVTVTYLTPEMTEETIDEANYRTIGSKLRFISGFAFPATACEPDAIRIEYDAGYEPANVPPEAKRAVVLMAMKMVSFSKETLFLRSEEVDGIGKIDYTVFDQAGEVLRKASDELLSGLKIYQL